MSAQTTDCHSTRQALLDLALAGLVAGDPPRTAAEHLRTCTACEDYRRGLASAPALLADGPLYSASLRRRTLAAIAAADEERATGLLPLLVPAAVASVAASLIGPVWVVTRLVEPLVMSSWMALGIAVLFCTSFGLAALGPGLIALMRLRDGARGITLHNG
jgi:predicted anti-sigma-YlaC factor YlaD